MKKSLLAIAILAISSISTISIVRAATIDEVEFNNATSPSFPAQSLGNMRGKSHTIRGDMSRRDGSDGFSFRVNRNSKLNAVLKNSRNQDADLFLYCDFNSNGVIDGGDSRCGSSFNDRDTPEMINRNLRRGSYIMQVAESGNGRGNRYTLKISVR